jgi:hypothetical protein
MNQIKQLLLDPEFKQLVPPVPKNELVHLERKIFKGMQPEEIYAWNNLILIGYNTYFICKNREIEYPFKSISFSSRNEAICWICNYYLKHDNLSEVMKKYLVGKQFDVQKNINEQKLKAFQCGKMPGYIYQTAIDLGKEYNMAQNTVYKYGVFSRSIDSIFSKEPELSEKILSGVLRISHDNIIELSHLPHDSLKSLNQNLSAEHIERIGYSEMRHELLWKKLPVPSLPKQLPPQTDIPIKQLPKYDPDSEISGLTLTIPSWISSINRTRSNADFRYISKNAKDKLASQLTEMKGIIDTMLNDIKEEYNG